MKRSAKLLTILCAGALCAGLLTACGGNAVNDKNIADAHSLRRQRFRSGIF